VLLFKFFILFLFLNQIFLFLILQHLCLHQLLSKNSSLLLSKLNGLLLGHYFCLLFCLFDNELLSLFLISRLKLLCQSSLGHSNGLCFLFLLIVNSLLCKVTLSLKCILSSLLFDLLLFHLLISLFSQPLLMKLFLLFCFVSLSCPCNCDLLSLSIESVFSLLLHFSKLLWLNLSWLSFFQSLIGRSLLLLCSCRSRHCCNWCNAYCLLLYNSSLWGRSGLFDDLNWRWYCYRHWCRDWYRRYNYRCWSNSNGGFRLCKHWYYLLLWHLHDSRSWCSHGQGWQWLLWYH